ncbi:MAG: acyltransferase [Cytophagia bacterium]|nr:MAG: acyltransferase [Cytophagia bacterium]TAG43233.1 MAG: acyltransferase [Cytophagia bacterium]
MEKKVKIGIIQTKVEENKTQNIKIACENIRKMAQKGANIICLQELFASLYFCNTENHQNFALAESIPDGETTQLFQTLAKELNVVIIASLFEKRAAGLYHNTTVVIDADGSYLGKYRKQHIPDDPGFYEKFYFTPGDEGYKVFETKFAKIGVLICWDQWYPEAARITSLMGAEILFYPTAIGWELDTDETTNQEQYNAWQLIQRSHAIANGVHVVSVNRIGKEDITQFWGGSFVANPMGTLLYQASHHEENLEVIEINTHLSEYYRTIWPFLRDRRIDTYQPITQRYLER